MNVRRQHFNEFEYDDIIDMELYSSGKGLASFALATLARALGRSC
jgi:hypothetical protein